MALRQGEVAVKFTSDGAGRVVADLTGIGQASAQAGGQLDKVGDSAARTGGLFENLAVAAKNALVGGGLAAVIAFTTRSVVEFQKLEGQLTTFTGSFERTREVMGSLREVAGQIGSSTNELTQAFINLTQRGIDPTTDRLTAIANIAAQTGKTVDDVSRSYGAAAQGNARILTQLGANFAETTDGIVVKFKDGTQQLVREGENFIEVLDRIGTVEFAGSAVRQTNTLAGAFNDLTAAAAELSVTFAEKGGLVDNLTKSLQVIGSFVGRVNDTQKALSKLREEASGFATAAGIISDVLGGNPGGAIEGAQRLFRGRAGPAVSAGGSVVPEFLARRNQTAATNELAGATQKLTEEKKKLTGADAAATREAEANARAVERQQAALQALLDELYGLEPATAEYRDQVAELVQLFQAGAISADEFTSLIAKAQERLAAAGDPAERLTGRPETYADLAQEQVDEYGRVWEDGVDSLGNSLRDVFRSVFGEAGDAVASLFDAVFSGGRGRNLAGTVARDSESLGRGFELDPGFTGPPTAQGGQGPAGQNLGTTIAQVGAELAPQLAAEIGGGGRNAQLGAQIGQVVGSIFGPVGSIVGSILGGLLGGAFDGTPRITVSGNTRGQERTGRSAFGTFGASTRDTDLPVAQLIEAVTRVDNALAGFLTGAERQAATGALRNFSQSSSGDDLSIEEVLRARVATVIRTVEPAFATFLNAIDDVEERIRQFEGLRVIMEQIDDIDRITVEAFGTPLEQQTARLSRFEEEVTKAGEALATAIDAQDLAEAAQASQDYQRAILELAQAQIEAAVQLEQALIDLDRSGRAFELNLLQRLANLPGGNGGAVVSTLRGNIDITRAGVLNSRTPEQSLAYLNEFIGTVDAWLERATAQVRANLQVQLQALDTERDGILGAAQARANAAAAAAQAASERDQAAIDALQEQIRLAQQWVSVLDRADGLIDAFRFGNANPIGLQSQFSNLSTEADALFAQFSGGGGNRTEIANRLLEILTQQQQVGASLFDRPSDESVALYNQILARINAVRDVAQPEAERARLLQEQMAALQGQTVNAVNSLTDATYFLTAEERQRLDEIEDERRIAEEEAQAALDEINDEAREYYEWARTTGQDLQRQQRDLVQAQLDTLTGGMAVQDFIALKQSEARDALYAIRDDLRTFLDSIRVVGAVVRPGGPGGPGGGGGGGGGDVGEGASAPSSVVVNTGDIVVTVGSGDPVEVGAAVRAALRDELPVLATALRRELQTA